MLSHLLMELQLCPTSRNVAKETCSGRQQEGAASYSSNGSAVGLDYVISAAKLEHDAAPGPR